MSERSKNHQYQVPRRFGLRTMLVVTALFATMFSIVTWIDLSMPLLVLYASFVIVIGGAQVVFERSPRLASILAGAVTLPFLKLVAYGIDENLLVSNTGAFTGLFAQGHFIYLFVFGGLYGYLAGTILAGLYLVMDKIKFMAEWRFAPSHIPTEAS